MIMWAIFVAPMSAGMTTRVAPERISFFSVEGDSARAMISIVEFSSRAVSVMNTLAESSGRTVASTRPGRSRPPRASPPRRRSPAGQVTQRLGLGDPRGLLSITTNVCRAATRSRASICPTRP